MENITQENIERCLKLEQEYLEKAEKMENKAKHCLPSQRGAYRSHAKQFRNSAIRWRNNYNAQMAWIAKNNRELWLKLRGEI